MDNKDQLKRIERLATIAHANQVDKLGVPYIEHPRAVVQILKDQGVKDVEVLTAAWLHDVLEDTKVTSLGLEIFGIARDTITAIELLTRTPDVPSEEYYKKIRANSIALQVKLADIWHNTSPERMSQLDVKTRARLTSKYEHAVAVLSEQDS